MELPNWGNYESSTNIWSQTFISGMDFIKRNIANDKYANRGHNVQRNGYTSSKMELGEDYNSISCSKNRIGVEQVGDMQELYSEAKETLKLIAELRGNWNGNGASSFSNNLLQKVRGILELLSAEPFISPTGCDSIQMEYEKESGEYLEFEISETEIQYFAIDKYANETEETWNLNSAGINRMQQLVVEFYG